MFTEMAPYLSFLYVTTTLHTKRHLLKQNLTLKTQAQIKTQAQSM